MIFGSLVLFRRDPRSWSASYVGLVLDCSLQLFGVCTEAHTWFFQVDVCRHQQDIISPQNWRQFDSLMRRGRKFTNISGRAMLSGWRKWGMSCCYCAYSTGIPKGQNKPILRPQAGGEQVDSYFFCCCFCDWSVIVPVVMLLVNKLLL